MPKKAYERNIWKYYFFVFFKNLTLILPIYMLFFLENGLSLTQAMFLFTAMSVIGLILEIPSGVFADLYGRKLSLMFGAIILFIGCFIRAAATNFIGFLIAICTASIGFAFISGADNAFLYDSLKEIKKEHLFKKIAGTSFFLNTGAMAVGAFIGGLLTVYGLRTVHYAMLIPMGALIFVSLTLKEPKLYKKVIKSNYLQHLRGGLIFSFTNKKVRNLILFSGFMIGLMMTSHQLFQPYMKDMGIDMINFGWIYLIFLGIAAVSAKSAYLIESRLGEKKSIIIIPIILTLQFLLMSQFSFYLAFLFIFFGEFTWGFTSPIIGHYINEHVESYQRATVLSINAMSELVIWAVFAPFIGWVADLWSLQTAFLALGIIVAIIAVIILSGWRLRKH
jgi:MFS family permease